MYEKTVKPIAMTTAVRTAGEDDGPVTGHIAEDGAKYGEDDQHTHDRDLAPAKVGDEG